MGTKKTDDVIVNAQDNQTKTSDASVSSQASAPLGPKTSSAKKVFNLLTVTILLIIVLGLYLYQKGYIKKDYPFIASPSVVQSTEAQPVGDRKSDQRLKDLQSELQALQASLARLEHTMTQQQERLDTLSASPNQVLTPSAQEFHKLSALLFLMQKMDQGLAYQSELSHLISVMGDVLPSYLTSKDLNALRTFAPFGIPTLSYLIDTYKALSVKRINENAYDTAETIWDRVKIFLSRLISIEKKSARYGDMTVSGGDEEQKAFLQLKHGNVQPLISLLGSSEALSPDESLWLDHAQAYQTAQKIITALKHSH